MTLQQRTKHFLLIALVVVFASYVSSLSLYVHSHRVDGEFVVHSHPYSSDADAEHEHTASQLVFLHSFSDVLVVGSILATFALAFLLLWSHKILFKPLLLHCNLLCLQSLRSRAPPVTFL